MLRCFLFFFFKIVWASIENEPASGLAKSDHVPSLNFDVLLLCNEAFIYKGTVSASQIIDKEISSVFMLEDCMSS